MEHLSLLSNFIYLEEYLIHIYLSKLMPTEFPTSEMGKVMQNLLHLF